jgi:Fe-S-cluster containining protein
MPFTLNVIKELLKTSVAQRKILEETYALLPATCCRRRTLCCSMLPEITLLEALAVINRMVDMSPSIRTQLIKKIVSYFFLNPAEIILCPFLEGRDCLIYRDRFLGCRAYGLWSKNYYEKIAERSRQSKDYVRNQWKILGISLPQEVTDFHIPYCSYVEKDGNVPIDDKMILHISDKIHNLSQQFPKWHQLFIQGYFSDMSFFLASLIFGVNESVRMKFAIVRDITSTGNKTGLDEIIGGLPDIFADLI